MPDPRKVEWSTVIAAVLASMLTLGTALLSTGRIWGASSSELETLKAQQMRLEERQTKLETLLLERLDKNWQAVNDLGKQLAAHEGESRALMGMRRGGN